MRIYKQVLTSNHIFMYITHMSVRHTNTSTEQQISDLLRRERGEKTLAEMSGHLGVTAQAIAQWESGNRQPDTHQLIMIAIEAGKAKRANIKRLALRCLNLRYPELHFKLAANGQREMVNA